MCLCSICHSDSLHRVTDGSCESEIRNKQSSCWAHIEIRRREVAMDELDAVSIAQSLRELHKPRLHFLCIKPTFCFQQSSKRFAFETLHRNCSKRPVFYEIVNPKNIGMDKLTVALHLLPQLCKRTRIFENGRWHKVQRYVLAEHFIMRKPDGATLGR